MISPHLAKLRILAIDANQGDVELLKIALSDGRRKNQIQAFEAGEAALQYLSSSECQLPDIIVLDLYLPVISGAEILQKLKDDPKTKAVPVVVLSDFRRPSEAEKAVSLGADAIFSKPYHLAELLQIGQSILSLVA